MGAEDAGSIYSDVRIRLDKLEADITSAIGAINGLGAKMDKSTAESAKKVKGNLDSIGVGSIAVGAAIAGAFRGMISNFAAYEQSMANVRAVTGASAAEFSVLKDAAEEAGATTRFSAAQAADALFYLGSAGFTATESVAALDGVLLLAQATGADLAKTSDTLAATISQFGLSTKDSTRVANVFAAANKNSQASLDKLQSSLRQVGPVSGALNVSLEETTASLEALYNAGFQGEQAGTALRSILLELSSSSSTTSKKLKELGVTVTDQNGDFIGLTESIEVLAESGVNLGEVFGKETAAQMLVLADTSQKTEGNLRDLEAAITDTNAASEAAAIQTDTLAGSMDEFSSQAESAGNAAIESVTPALRGLLAFGAGLFKLFGDLPRPIQATITTIAALVGAFAIASAGASAFGVTLLTAVAPIAPIILSIGAAVALIAGIATIVDDAAKATERLITENIKLNSSIKNNQKAVSDIIGVNSGYNQSNKLTQAQIEELVRLYPELTGKVNLYGASLEEVAKATRAIDSANALKALAETEKAIKDAESSLASKLKSLGDPFQKKAYEDAKKDLENINKEIEIVTKIGNKSALDALLVSRAEIESNIDFIGKVISARKIEQRQIYEDIKVKENEIAKLREQAIEQREISNGTLFARQDAESKAIASAAKIASAQNTSTKKILDNLEAEKVAQLKNITDIKLRSAITEAFAAKSRDLQIKLASETARAESEKTLAAEENAKKLKALREEYLNDLDRINAKEIEDLKLAGKDEALKTLIRESAAKKRTELANKEANDKKKAEEDLKNYLAQIGLTDLERIRLQLEKERDERLAQAALLISDAVKLEEAKAKINADYTQKLKEAEDKSANDEIKLAKDRVNALAEIGRGSAESELSDIEETRTNRLNALDERYIEYKKLIGNEVDLEKWKADQIKLINKEADDEIAASTADRIKKEVDEVKKYVDNIGGALSSLISALSAFAAAESEIALAKLEEDYDAQVETIDKSAQDQIDAINLVTEEKLKAAGVADLTALESAQKALDDAIEKGDEEAIAEAEKELTKQEILSESNKEKALIDKQLKIDQINNETAYAKEKARLEYEGATIQWEAQLASAIVGGAMGAINAFSAGMQFGPASVVMAPLLTGLAIASSALNIAAINAQKPKPPKLATGGIILPSVGGTQAIMAENGSPELALNAGQSGEALMQMFADKIVGSMGGNSTGQPMNIYVLMDKQVLAEAVTSYQNNGRVEVRT